MSEVLFYGALIFAPASLLFLGIFSAALVAELRKPRGPDASHGSALTGLGGVGCVCMMMMLFIAAHLTAAR